MKRFAFFTLLLSSLTAFAHANGVSIVSTKTHIWGDWTEQEIFYPANLDDPNFPNVVPINYSESDTFDFTGNSPTIPLTGGAQSGPFGAAYADASALPFSTSLTSYAYPGSYGYYYDDGSSILITRAEINISTEATTLFHPDGSKMKVNLHLDGNTTFPGGSSLVILTDLTNPSELLNQLISFYSGGYGSETTIETNFFFDVNPGDTYQLDILSSASSDDDNYITGTTTVKITTMPEQSATIGLLAISALGIIGIRRRTMACHQRV